MKKYLFNFLFALLYTIPLCSCSNHSRLTGSEKAEDSIVEKDTNQTEEQNEDATENSNNDDNEEANDDDENRTVDYYNPNTGTSSTYYLDVEMDDGGVEQINFDNGGYIDQNHITDQETNDDGSITVTTDEGAEYTVEPEGE
jgi:hypothetical protein